MIKIRLASIGRGRPLESEILRDDTVKSAVHRAIGHLSIGENKPEDHFQVLLNGNKVASAAWPMTKIKDTDILLVAPIIKGGNDSNALLRTGLIIAATYYGGGLFTAGTLSSAFAAAGASIGASLLLNSLIPPPVPEGIDAGLGGNISASQMYSITGQTNQTKKFAQVPKVYGQHRMFPNLAAVPYTELQADPASGNLVQYFYAIYDFGLGPMHVTDLKIGDSPITDFSDVFYNFVDLNRPAIDEGVWDEGVREDFSLYKGDVQSDPTSVALNGNESAGGDPATYEAVRNASPNTTGVPQEITISLSASQGLYATNSNGQTGIRTVMLQIEFSKVGEEVWRPYNDFTYVQAYEETGSDGIYVNQEFISPFIDSSGANIWPTFNSVYTNRIFTFPGQSQFNNGYVENSLVLAAGSNTVVLKTPEFDIVGNDFRFADLSGAYQEVKKIISSTPYSAAGYTVYTLESNFERDILVARITRNLIGGVISPNDTASFIPQNIPTAIQKVVGRASVSRNSFQPVNATIKFTPREVANYKVRVKRLYSFSDPLEYTSTIRDSIIWGGLVTRFDSVPIATDKRHIFLELKIRATNQLNGNIQNLSGLCVSALDVYDPDTQTWNKELSQNPAWVLADLLTGEINKRKIDKSRLDTDSLVEWAEFCEEIPDDPPARNFVLSRFTTNLVLDYSPTLQTAINQITNAAQASLNVVNGKYGVLIDKFRSTPVQIFTPRNSYGFRSTRNYTNRPHGIKVTYIDPLADWEAREVVVYDNGYTEINATNIESVDSFACTNADQAWRLGRYMLAQNRLRQETISIEVDFENLVCTRGDFVKLTQDVMKAGGFPARVNSISVNQITIDDAIETDPMLNYGFTFRRSDGTIHTNTLTVVNATTFDLDGAQLPADGEMIVIGEVGSITLDCIVKSVVPSEELSATIVLVEKADAIYDAESTGDLPDYTPQISATADTQYSPPGEVEDLIVADYYFQCANGGGLNYFVLLDWNVPQGAAFDLFEVYADSGKGYNLVNTTKESFYLYQTDRANLGVTHRFKILAVSATGRKLELGQVGEVTQLVARKSTPPDNVANFNMDITNEVLQFFWEQTVDCSVAEYFIRYSPTLDATWERSIPLLRANRDQSSASTQARTGTYLIKAVDYEGNQSLVATAQITTIPDLFNLNIIEETTDFPALAGSKDRVVVETGGLLLDTAIVGGVDTQEYYSEGYYYYEEFLDLGEIYTVRLQSRVEAEGFTLGDLMSNWVTLDSVPALSQSGFSDWDVQTEYRTTDVFNVMADWATLASIDPISEGDQDNWTEWKKFSIGDATGRIFQFRLKLESSKVSVTPRVFDGTIRADMPDRIDSYEDVAVPDTGATVAYDPPFKGPGTSPNVQVSIQNGQSGDYWEFGTRDLDGFSIQFFNSSDVAVARTADFAVKGFGRKATAVI